MKNTSLFSLLGFLLLVAGILNAPSFAEPYLAARTGFKCSVCHVNKSGGGKRTDFGVVYSQTTLPMMNLGDQDKPEFFDGKISDAISLGANLRADDITSFSFDADTTHFPVDRQISLTEANLYIQAELVPDKLTLYLDQILAPSTNNREFFGMVQGLPLRSYIKFGRMLLPYGLRLLDDRAFIRNNTGYTYNLFDMGLEVGLEPGPHSLVFNWTDTRFSTVASWVFRRFRVGFSYGNQFEDFQGKLPLVLRFLDPKVYGDEIANPDKYLYGIFGSLHFGIFTWLGEVDWIVQGPKKSLATLNELNILVTKGLNLKLTHEFYDRDLDISTARDGQDRLTLGAEPFLSPFLQLGIFYRINRFIPQNGIENQDNLIVRVHFFF